MHFSLDISSKYRRPNTRGGGGHAGVDFFVSQEQQTEKKKRIHDRNRIKMFRYDFFFSHSKQAKIVLFSKRVYFHEE